MKVIGMTGNIASGKTTVLRMLQELGAQVIDTDQVVHALMKPESPVYRFIVYRFGQAAVSPTGEIDRAKVGQKAFSDPCALAYLEGLLHPWVYREVGSWIAKQEAENQGSQGERVYVVDGVKVERELLPHCDSFWVVYARPEQQLERMMRDRGMSEEEAKRRLAAQIPWEVRLKQADVVIDNSGTIEETERQVREEWEKLLA